MNSKQRRKDARVWQWHVTLSYEKVRENGYDRMWDWCFAMFGNNNRPTDGGWREKHFHVGTHWQFASKEKATLFMLRWA